MAAIVMVGVFSIFATLQFMFLKQFGVGLAAAVLIDATIVRAVLLPATMKLLGDWNWYLPKWLEWLPQLHHEASPAPPESQAGAPAPASRNHLSLRAERSGRPRAGRSARSFCAD